MWNCGNKWVEKRKKPFDKRERTGRKCCGQVRFLRWIKLWKKCE